MKTIWLALALALASLSAQQLSQAEQESLTQALGEAGNSAIEFVRAVENHLKKFPNSPKRPELERALIKSAIDLNDDRRVLLVGESVLQREPDNLQILEYVTTALLRTGDKTNAERALAHAQHIEHVVHEMFKNDKFVPGAGREAAKHKDDYDRALARVRLMMARAHGLLGHTDEAIKFAEASYKDFPSVEAGREASKWLAAAGKNQEALQYLADAFTITGLRSADPEGPNDRAKMAELYKKLTGSETGLGDVVLKAYDSTASELAARRAKLRELDPNSQIKDPMRFTLSSLSGEKLHLSSLLGKVIVLDFWATWCVPCRQQHPLYEQVKEKFKDTGDVVFLSIDTDEDHSLVKPFMAAEKWTNQVYFEDGLQSLMQVTAIPTTVVFGKNGGVVSRMLFMPERFVDMLTERIDEALGKPPKLQAPKGASSQ